MKLVSISLPILGALVFLGVSLITFFTDDGSEQPGDHWDDADEDGWP